MGFLSKLLKKPVVVNCYTPYGFIYEHAQIKPTSSFLPSWYKSLPAKIKNYKGALSDGKSMKLCTGVGDLMKTGFVIPMWSDLVVQLGDNSHEEYKWEFSAEQCEGVVHPAEQRGSYMPANQYSHLKLQSYWSLHCDEPVKFAWIQNDWMWDKPDEVIIPPAILDFHSQHACHVNMMLPRGSEEKVIKINHGKPMAQLIPITDRKVVFKHHLVKSDEYQKLLSFGGVIKFHGSQYHKRQNERKCPFSTGDL